MTDLQEGWRIWGPDYELPSSIQTEGLPPWRVYGPQHEIILRFIDRCKTFEKYEYDQITVSYTHLRAHETL